MDTFTDKIKSLEAEIAATDERLQATLKNVEAMRPELTNFEQDLRQAKRVHAIEGSAGSQKSVNEAKKKLDGMTTDFDNSEILSEALTDKLEQLGKELAEAKSALAGDESGRLAAKAQGLADSYDKAIRAAFDAALRLKLLRQMVSSRGGFVNVGDTYAIFDQVFQGFPLIGSNGGSPLLLRQDFVRAAEIERIQQELLTV